MSSVFSALICLDVTLQIKFPKEQIEVHATGGLMSQFLVSNFFDAHFKKALSGGRLSSETITPMVVLYILFSSHFAPLYLTVITIVYIL